MIFKKIYKVRAPSINKVCCILPKYSKSIRSIQNFESWMKSAQYPYTKKNQSANFKMLHLTSEEMTQLLKKLLL